MTASHHSLWQRRLGPVPTRIGHLGKPKDDGTLLPAPDWRRPPSPLLPDPIRCPMEGGTWLLPSNKSTSPTALSPVSRLHEDTRLCPMPTRTQTSAGGAGHLTGGSSTVTSCCHQSQVADSIPRSCTAHRSPQSSFIPPLSATCPQPGMRQQPGGAAGDTMRAHGNVPLLQAQAAG